MFGNFDPEPFPSRSNNYIDNLMSLNTLEGNKSPPKPQGDSRSLRTDDIIGAKPKGVQRRPQEPEAYNGLNMPSYSKPGQKSSISPNDYTKNAAKFYGSTPESKHHQQFGSPSKVQSNNNIDPAVAAKFFGSTPPRSRVDPYVKDNVPKEEIAKFFGATPAQSRGNNYSKGVSEKDLAGFYGVTPVQTGYPQRDNRLSPQIPRKDAEKFFGVTPVQTGYNGAGNVYAAGNKQGRNDKAGVSDKDLAGFFGVTPVQTGYNGARNLYPVGNQQGRNGNPGVSDKDLAGFFGTTPPGTGFANKDTYKGGFAKAGSQVVNIPPKALSGFFGSTPENTGYPSKYQNPSSPTPYNLYNKSPSGNLENLNKAKYGGIPKSTSPYKQNPDLSPKAVANFYGVTPPPSGYSPMKNSAQKASLSPKEIANFYGVTPPPTGKGQSNLNPKALANFYGVTPPASGKPGAINKGNDIFSDNAAKFFGSDSVSPEFQYAANIATKPVFNPYARHKNNHENTASRIFN